MSLPEFRSHLLNAVFVMNENRRNKVFAMIKQLKKRAYGAHADFLLNCDVHVIFISTLPLSLTSFILNIVDCFRDAVDVTSSTTRQHESHVPAFMFMFMHWKSRTGCEEIFPQRK